MAKGRSQAAAAALLFACAIVSAPQAHALSELQQQPGSSAAPAASDKMQPAEDAAPDATTPDENAEPPADMIPDDSDADTGDEQPSDLVRPDVDATKPPPEIQRDLTKLPEPVRRMHDLIVEACKSGDLEKLKPLLGTGEDATQLSLGGLAEDPLKFLHEVSGDEGGQEILAILLEVMEQGFVHLNAGTTSEVYVWPYYFAVPLDKLTAQQRVELFTLVTAGDYEDMKNFGAYNFYRSGITPEGRWLFFVAGD